MDQPKIDLAQLDPAEFQPPNISGLVPYVNLNGAAEASAFYQRAFAGVEIVRLPADDGKRLMHCHLKINGGDIFISDCFPEHGFTYEPSRSFTMHLQFADGVDEAWERAVGAGCEVVMPLQLMFWGDRYGQVRDPFGVQWSLAATPKS